MKEEEKIIKNTIKRTKEYDRTLSPYACKTSECQKLRKEEIGFIFQNYNLIESLTIKNNILFSPRLNKVNQQTQLERLHELTKMLNIEEIIDKYPSQCSGGQQQRAAIARALINEPKIIFADEPTGNLDSKTTMEVLRLMQRIVNSLS